MTQPLFSSLQGSSWHTAAELLDGLDFRPLPSRPFVFASMVMTADGRASIDGGSASIGSEADTEMLAELRVLPDAVLVGTGTMRAEGYRRPVRLASRRERRVARGLSGSPLVVCATRSGDVPWEVPLFADPLAEVLVFARGSAPPGLAASVEVRPPAALAEVLRILRTERGARVVMGEGGPAMNRALLAAGLVDELFLTLAPRLAGGDDEVAIVAGEALRPVVAMRLEWVLRSASGELFLRYRVCH